MPSARFSPTLLAFIAIPLWAATPVLVLLMGHQPALFLMGMRFFIGGLLLTAIALLRGEGLFEELRKPKGVWALSFCGIFLSQILYVQALQLAPAAQANFINYLWPLFVLAFTVILQKRRLKLRETLAMLAGFAGCAIILWPSAGHADLLNADYWPGYALSLFSGMMWAAYSALMRHYYADVKTGLYGAHFLVYSILSFVLCGLFTPIAVQLDAGSWIYLLLFGIIPIAYPLWEQGIKRGNFGLLTSCAYFIPMLSAVCIALLSPDSVSWPLFLGGTLVVLAPFIGHKRKISPLR